MLCHCHRVHDVFAINSAMLVYIKEHATRLEKCGILQVATRTLPNAAMLNGLAECRGLTVPTGHW